MTSQPKFSLAAPPSLEWPPSTKLLSTRKVGRIYSNIWYKTLPLPSLLNTENPLLQRRECYIREIFRANLASVLRFLGQKLKVTPRGNTLLSKEIKLCWQKYERLKSWCLEKEDKEWYLGIYLKVWVCAQELPKFRRVWESFKQFVAGLCRIFIMFGPDSRDH